jgi:hypothetical protein
VPLAGPEEFRAARSVLQDGRRSWLRLPAVQAPVFDVVQEDQVRSVTDPAAGVPLGGDEGLEHVYRDLGTASLVAEKVQPGQLLPWRGGPEMHVSRLEKGRRELLETWLGRDSQVGSEGPAAIRKLIDDEGGRGARQDAHPLRIETEAAKTAQVEVIAHLCHQAEAVIKQGGSGKCHRKAGPAGVRERAVHRPVRGETDVADQNQI